MTSTVVAGNPTEGTTPTNQTPPVAAGATPTKATESNAPATPAPAQPAPTTGTLLGEKQATKQDTTEGGEPKAANAPQGAPEKYELKSPVENMTLDTGVLQHFEGVARELNLPNAAAQKIIDKLAPALAERDAKVFADTVAQWREATLKDPELGGGDEAKLKQNLQLAEKALDAFGDDSLRTLLVNTGAGNRAELIRFFARVGKTVSDDTVRKGSQPGVRDERDPIEKLADTFR